MFLQSVKNSTIYADHPTFLNPYILTGDSLRPDLLLSVSNDFLYIVESTVGFETNLGNIAKRNKGKYKNLEANFKSRYKKVKFISIVICTLSVFDSSSVDFLEMLEDLKFDKTCRHYVFKKVMAIAVRTLYYVFCRRNKDWDNPELMAF